MKKTCNHLNRRNELIYQLLTSFRPTDVTRISICDVADLNGGYYTPCSKANEILTEDYVEKLEEYLNQRDGLAYLDYRPNIVGCSLLFPSSVTGNAISVRTVVKIRKSLSFPSSEQLVAIKQIK